MQIQNIFEIEGMDLPAGRNTKVFVGPQAGLTARAFVQGYVTIFPDGGSRSIPMRTRRPIRSCLAAAWSRWRMRSGRSEPGTVSIWSRDAAMA